MNQTIYVLLSIYDKKNVPNGYESITLDELAQKMTSKEVFHFLFHYESVILLCPSIEMLPTPFVVAVMCRFMTVRRCYWIDDRRRWRIYWYTLFYLFAIYIRDRFVRKRLVENIKKDIEKLASYTYAGDIPKDIKCAYIRTDEPCHIDAGGSVGHIAGVVNNFESVTHNAPIFVSTEKIPTVNHKIQYHELPRCIPYRNISSINQIAYNSICYRDFCNILLNSKFNLIYHRYSLGSYSVAKYALVHKIPYIVEYNGSELWIINHWAENKGSANVPYYDILREAEKIVLDKASLITCVSQPLKDQLIQMGISEARILVNPNGVDTDKYNPNIDGMPIRIRYGIKKEETVIGFIGTFGAWHGAERLAAVFSSLTKKYNNIHLLMIGDGLKMPEVRENLKAASLNSYTLTGMIPQEQGPEYLAACDILVSPTLPNPDGTPFFGSPTKTFEYMAMGKAIVVSDMDQMSDVFEHNKTALMFTPGNDDDLTIQISKLVEDESLRETLGTNARKEAELNHSWLHHANNIIIALSN